MAINIGSTLVYGLLLSKFKLLRSEKVLKICWNYTEYIMSSNGQQFSNYIWMPLPQDM